MVSKIIIFLLLLCSACYAIDNLTIDEVKNHAILAQRLNQVIDQINQDKADKKDVDKINTHYQTTAQDLQILRGNLSNVRKTVGDPTGTVADVKTKFILLMDTLDKASQK